MRRPSGRKPPIDAVLAWGGPVTSSVWLVFLAQPLQALFAAHKPLWFDLVMIGQLLLAVGLYLSLVLRHTYSGAEAHSPHLRRHVATLAVMAAVSVTAPLIGGSAWGPALIFTSSATGSKLPARISLPSIGALSVLTFLVNVIIGGSWIDVGQAVVLVGTIGLITAGIARMIVTIRALESAREELARLAVAEERLRMARDLHDLLGHSLSLIAVKSELARRLVATHAEQAMAEIADIESVSRRALLDVRAAVSGYRQISVARELESSREILAAAQIGFDAASSLDGSSIGGLSPRAESVLAWTVREGVTNVVRHGHARRCAIRLERVASGVRCEIRNDRRDARPGHEARAMADSRFGNGLSGLSERVRALGGRMEAASLADGGFLLAVTLPAGAADDRDRERERGIPHDSRTVG